MEAPRTTPQTSLQPPTRPQTVKGRRVFKWAAIALGVVTLLFVIVGIVLQTPWGLERVRRLIESQANAAIDGTVSIGRLRGSVFGDLTLENFSISRGGEPLVTAESARVEYSPVGLLMGDVAIDNVVLRRPTIRAIQDEQGWNLARLAKPRQSQPGESGRFDLHRVELIEGSVLLQFAGAEAHRLEDLDLEASLAYRDLTWTVDIDRANAVDVTTGVPLQSLSAELAFGGDRIAVEDLELATSRTELSGDVVSTTRDGRRLLEVDVTAGPLSFHDLHAYLPAVPDTALTPRVQISASGALTDLRGHWTVSSTAGESRGQFTTSGADDLTRIQGQTTLQQVNLAPWLGRPALESRLTGKATFDVTDLGTETPHVAFTFDGRDLAVAGYTAGRVDARGTFHDGVVTADATGQAYSAAITTDLRYDIERGALDAEGRFGDLRVAALPARFEVPRLDTDLSGAYDVSLVGDDWTADVTLDPSTIEGARVQGGTEGHVASRSGRLSYRAKGQVAGLDLQRLARAWPAMPQRFETLPGTLTTTFDLEGAGTTLDAMTLAGTARITDTTLSGLRIPGLDVNASLQQGRLAADVTGRVENLTGAALGLPDTADFRADATTDLHLEIPDLRGPIAIDALDLRGTVLITDATYRDLQIERAAWKGALTAGILDIAEFDAAGPAFSAKANGRLAITGDEVSNLNLTANLIELERFSDLTGQELDGTAKLVAKLTGPPDKITATGTLGGHTLTIGPAQALTLDTKFSAVVEDQQWAEVDVNADVKATFVEVADQRLEQITSKVTYTDGTLGLDTRLESTGRTLEVTGRLVPHPDHQEVHLDALRLAAGGGPWALPAGQSATIQYGGDRINVDSLVLVHGDSRILVDGAIGDAAPAADPLTVQIERVQIADVNQMLLGTHTLTGEVNGTIRATGPISAPQAKADLVIANGTADGIGYDRLTAEGSYAAPRLTLDVALEAGAAGRLLAAGTMPLGPAPKNGARPPYDLRIESPGIQLGLFQPLTDEVTKLTGQAVLDLRVAGPADAPTFAGRAAINKGAFTVPYTGMTYVNLNAAFAVDGTQLTVEQFRLEDEDGHALTMTGGATVPGAGPATAFDLYISGDEIHVLNNPLGDVAVTFDLHALGDLQSPLVVGTIEVDHATVEVDDVLEQLQSTGYEPLPEERAAAEKTPDLTPDGPTGASYSITLAMPENVVLRGRDLRTGSGPIGLGDINITIGGALSLSKDQGRPVVINGEVDVIRGNYDFQGRRFAIARGSTLTFGRDAVLNPRLNVTAERVISGVTARVRVTGTAREPVIALSSSPSLSQSDILSLIIFGSPTNELLAGERVSLAATAGRLAAGAVATPLADSVARALDLDLFEIRPSDTAGGAVVTVGQQVSDRLFVGFRHEFGPSEGSQVSFEYRLNEFWRVVTSFANSPDRSQVPPRSERAGIDLFYVIRR